MSGAAFLRIKKIKGSGIITSAARHNRREIQAEIGAAGSIDPTRSHLNETLKGPSTADDVGLLAKGLMTSAGVGKLRKDAVMALEIVFSLPPCHQIDDRAFFTDCSAWLVSYMGGIVLSVDVHRDEAAPHCHVLLLPLIDDRMDGSNMLGGKQKLMALQKNFFDNVASRYGLSKAPARLLGATKQAASQAVIKQLREAGDKALQSDVWPTLRDMIENDPAPYLLAMGIELKVPTKTLKTMANIFTSKGKGNPKTEKPIGFGGKSTAAAGPKSIPIGFQSQPLDDANTMLCRVPSRVQPVLPRSKSRHSDDCETCTVVERDDEVSTSQDRRQWDADSDVGAWAHPLTASDCQGGEAITVVVTEDGEVRERESLADPWGGDDFA